MFEYTQGLKCSSFLVMTCFLLRDSNMLPKKELHLSPLVPFQWVWAVPNAKMCEVLRPGVDTQTLEELPCPLGFDIFQETYHLSSHT